MMHDTIFALSSGAPPAAIGIIRISGPAAGAALVALAGRVPAPRTATLMPLRDAGDERLDDALVLWFPGPRSATGEDCAELHCHGGRAVIAAIEQALGAVPGLRAALPGEFTRRAFTTGRIDLAEAEGLADLLSAETELQRRSAIAMASGALSTRVETWRTRLLGISALVEAQLDFADEDDVAPPQGFLADAANLRADIAAHLAAPRAERLRDGFRVVLAGPPNAGKSTLFNALIEDEAAIASPLPGTTRDLIERSVAIDAVPFTFVDTAGLAEATHDPIEAIGIARAQAAQAGADLVLWLGPADALPGNVSTWRIAAQADRAAADPDADHRVSAHTGEGMHGLRSALVARARAALPKPGSLAVNARQHALLADVAQALDGLDTERDLLVAGERLRLARVALDRLLGRTATEDMLDALFGRFCIGK